MFHYENFRTTISLSILLFALGFVSSVIGQEEKQSSKKQSSKPEWVDSMPVSLNGKIDKSLPKYWISRRWHDKFRRDQVDSWAVRRSFKPEEYFEDPSVVSLCTAIFDKDVSKMERLIKAGVNVNTTGKKQVTPLLWAFLVDDDPRPFGCLLEHGANPNIVTSEAGITGSSGMAVVHLVTLGNYNRHFSSVFEHGGDPNLKWNNESHGRVSPTFSLVGRDTPDAVERLQLLISKGARLNERWKTGGTYTSISVAHGDEKRCRFALVALNAGADHQRYYEINANNDFGGRLASFQGCHFRLIHYLAAAESNVNKDRQEMEQLNYRAVIAWLEEHGESLKDAKADLVRWKTWIRQGKTDLIEKEHQERLKKEAAKKSSDEKTTRTETK